jgi:hypothetical protein
MGVLKGSSATSVVAITGLCIALVPLGIVVLRTPPTPRLRTVLGWVVVVTGQLAALFLLGQLG